MEGDSIQDMVLAPPSSFLKKRTNSFRALSPPPVKSLHSLDKLFHYLDFRILDSGESQEKHGALERRRKDM